ncbi:glycosyl hydrolase catalytic core-domain-containing protein [Microdochium trichocladiopsis]|uniref:Glycosyl hydrolase catalytic core-domain-containing protein n=1 Tax=Microdochium trichocladiopsis TaxID=1682393 RepID=A0A9P8YCY2_9PEZI|nr:glycosyl hydrolase catalytic core-domain-containing protein [Microdochium trichocladiopsis]KAH7034646.1 glycosyl hydrolase catalytic core-domain-containing protein [Microdochium trichocladiopsis]
MRTQNHQPRGLGATALALLSAAAILSTPTAAQDSNSNSTSSNNGTSASTSKRGLSIHQGTSTQDFNIFLQADSPIAWYYTWSPWPNEYIEKAAATNNKKIEFIPLLHGIDNLDSDLERLRKLTPAQSHRLLTFNEPDGEPSTGGSGLDPRDTAQAYVDKIMPLRKGSSEGGRWLISHPVVTGSGRGLDWLRDFCDACEDINGDNGGCPTDFVAAHWYGDFLGLEGWLKQLREFYDDPKHSFRPDLSSGGDESNELRVGAGSKRRSLNERRQNNGDSGGGGGGSGNELEIIVTEMGLPQQDAEATQSMLNQTIPYLDKASWVSGYSWFGLFREGSDDAEGWAGEAVAMLDGDGKLTEIGAMFLGGQDDGFTPGESVGGDQSGDGSGDTGSLGASVKVQGLLAAVCVGFSLSLLVI